MTVLLLLFSRSHRHSLRARAIKALGGFSAYALSLRKDDMMQ